MKFDTEGFRWYLHEMCKKLNDNEKACQHFVFNLEFVESIESKYEDEPDCMKLMDLVETFICKECRFPMSSHPVCSKYNKTDSKNEYLEDLCGSCGMQGHYHEACQSFTFVQDQDGKLQKKCTTCGKGYFDHIGRLEKEGVKQCHSFKDNSHGYCLTCSRHITRHMHNEKYYAMSTRTRDDFSLKNLQLSVRAQENLVCAIMCKNISEQILAPDFVNLMKIQKEHNYYDNL
ncbi:MAG: hypothetical protein Terrestrivirus1_115 [Terrestrivirus sp.]|uniref:Uncharacterized protein n=1 Tax=Terrestrivirus sp. TaxID=2487775 RepID=A0A3G4ZMH1_9VIRU|nr:MAG: hypothetical protein Terrestrivirus1_115 [Terrestrivirus sp.]